ncbi:MAG: MFS transporter [Acidimicrobiia bacterium]|nr:MFS transporter [Acidimicrobiia bacterium]
MKSTAADPLAPARTDPTRELGQRELIAMLGMATAAAALGIDTMLPAFGDMRADLGLAPDSAAIGNIITFYFAGMAVGQLFWGPLADRFGRRRTLHVSLVLYALAAVAAALSPTLATVVITRSLWGFAAAGPRIVAMTVVRDSFEGLHASQAMSSLMAVFIVIPIVAPSIGAGFVAVASWRLLFAFCALFAVVMLTWSSRLPETLQPEHRMDLSARRIAAAGRRVLANRQSAGYLLAVTALMGAFVAYLSGFENVIDQAYDKASAFPFIFGGLAAVMGVMMVTNRRLVARFGAVRVARAAFAGEVLVAAAGVAVAGATDGRPPLWAFLLLMAGLLSCQAVLLPNLTSMALEPMGTIAGVASSVIGAFQTAGGAILGGVVMSTFDDTTRPLLLGFLMFALLGTAFVAFASRGQTG